MKWITFHGQRFWVYRVVIRRVWTITYYLN